jgi:hypothetical protein
MTIAVVFHATASAARMRAYRIWHCAQMWAQMGIDVRVVIGPAVPPGVDLVIPHVDLSVLPPEYRRLLDAPGIVLNRRVVDIRRRSFSRNLVSADDGYNGPVIVKTNNNCGGHPERAVVHGLSVPRRVSELLRRGTRSARRIAAARSFARLAYASSLPTRDYAVFATKRQVPRAVFQNTDLVVEKFLPETDGRFHYLRSYTFLGNEGLAVRSRSEEPVVIGSVGAELEFVTPDESIVAARHALGFDYGKFDYLMHDGEAVLLDVNTTPTFGAVYSPEVQARICSRLASGISAWFPDLHSFPRRPPV